MSMQLNDYLAAAVKRLSFLEETKKKEKKEYTAEIEEIRMLIEILKEQFSHENTNNTAG